MRDIKKKIKSQKGSITLFVLISIMFFIIILTGIYISSSNKVQQREKEIEKIQEEYKQKDVNDIYEEIYNNYISQETPTIQAYVGDVLKGEVVGENTNTKKLVYIPSEKATLKFLSKNTTDTYAYAIAPNGKKTKVEGDTLEVDVTAEGTTIYVYINYQNNSYSQYYTAITVKSENTLD